VVNLVGGYSEPGKVHETGIEEFEAQLRLNLRPTYLMCHAAIPALLANGGGSIVCVGSRAALQPFGGVSGYVTAKAGVMAFVRALDAEYRDDFIRASAVVPSIIDTPANRAAQPNGDYGKWVQPGEIARVILFLCSEESSAISGAAVPVYGRPSRPGAPRARPWRRGARVPRHPGGDPGTSLLSTIPFKPLAVWCQLDDRDVPFNKLKPLTSVILGGSRRE
jgi:hypothetical protein